MGTLPQGIGIYEELGERTPPVPQILQLILDLAHIPPVVSRRAGCASLPEIGGIHQHRSPRRYQVVQDSQKLVQSGQGPGESRPIHQEEDRVEALGGPKCEEVRLTDVLDAALPHYREGLGKTIDGRDLVTTLLKCSAA